MSGGFLESIDGSFTWQVVYETGRELTGVVANIVQAKISP